MKWLSPAQQLFLVRFLCATSAQHVVHLRCCSDYLLRHKLPLDNYGCSPSGRCLSHFHLLPLTHFLSLTSSRMDLNWFVNFLSRIILVSVLVGMVLGLVIFTAEKMSHLCLFLCQKKDGWEEDGQDYLQGNPMSIGMPTFSTQPRFEHQVLILHIIWYELNVYIFIYLKFWNKKALSRILIQDM